MTVGKAAATVVGSFLFMAAAAAAGELTGEEMSSLFHQGNEAFSRANAATDDSVRERLYDKAILSYEKIINDGGVRNARLYYNLANAYFLREDVGRAILNYRRAEKLDSANGDIKKNLAFARSRRMDKVKLKTEKRVLQTLFFWHYDFSIKTRFTLSCLFFAVVCVSLTVMVWLGRSAPVTVIAVVSGILTICFFGSVMFDAHTKAHKICGVITATEVVAHQADWQKSPASFKEPLHAGTEFDLLEQRPGWLHIKLADNSDGWLPDDAAEVI